MQSRIHEATQWLSITSLSDSDDEESATQVMWIDEVSYTRQPLIENLKSQSEILLFLKVTGILWPSKSDSFIEIFTQIMWNICVRIVMVTCPALVLFNFFYYLLGSATFAGFDLSSWSLDVVFIMQSMSLLSSLVAIRKRLNSVSSALELSFFGKSLKYCIIYFALSFFPSILYPLYHILLLMPLEEQSVTTVQLIVYGILPLCELIVSGFLAVHMLFVLVDIQTLAANFTEMETNSRASYVSSRRTDIILSEIHHRARSSLFEVIPIVATAALEIAILCYMVRSDFLARDYMPMLLLIFLFLKEIQFLLLILGAVCYCVWKRMFLARKKKL